MQDLLAASVACRHAAALAQQLDAAPRGCAGGRRFGVVAAET